MTNCFNCDESPCTCHDEEEAFKTERRLDLPKSIRAELNPFTIFSKYYENHYKQALERIDKLLKEIDE